PREGFQQFDKCEMISIFKIKRPKLKHLGLYLY
ncbi:MAG: hypothetical protein ACI9OE_002721, partial [Mariniflexile sp.]